MSLSGYILPADDWLTQHLRDYHGILRQIPTADRPRFDGLLEAAAQQLEYAVALIDGDASPADEP
jgi:hypothetical protein